MIFRAQCKKYIAKFLENNARPMNEKENLKKLVLLKDKSKKNSSEKRPKFMKTFSLNKKVKE